MTPLTSLHSDVACPPTHEVSSGGCSPVINSLSPLPDEEGARGMGERVLKHHPSVMSLKFTANVIARPDGEGPLQSGGSGAPVLQIASLATASSQ